MTFTFGGLKCDPHGRVLDNCGRSPGLYACRDAGRALRQLHPGLYACGEMLGGLFSGNYPGGSGLAAGVVFGRRAGSLA
ncbi:FAD-binding protein [Amycolatopsis sp. NPDC000740]|uniref:FAD-binding protein n=1 Tax=Amycolatopsis sp. NPDC000740 TaxID=3154269 RepID=UPI00332C2D1B